MSEAKEPEVDDMTDDRNIDAGSKATEKDASDPSSNERQAYRKPTLTSGERMEKTTLASCYTGSFCGPYAFEV